MKVHLAIAMVIGILLGSMHLRINHHYCNSELESIAFFSEAQPCEHANAQNDLPPCHKKEVDTERCCSTRSVYVKAQDWFKYNSSNPIELAIKTPIKNYLKTTTYYYALGARNTIRIDKPPDIRMDHQSKYQVFII